VQEFPGLLKRRPGENQVLEVGHTILIKILYHGVQFPKVVAVIVRRPALIRYSKAADPFGSAAYGALDENFVRGFLVFGEESVVERPGRWRVLIALMEVPLC
jgi:hypothetical protein